MNSTIYSILLSVEHFQPIAFAMRSVLGESTYGFLDNVDRRFAPQPGDLSKWSFLYRRISVFFSHSVLQCLILQDLHDCFPMHNIN